MTKALIDASADTLAEVENKALGDTSTNVKAEGCHVLILWLPR